MGAPKEDENSLSIRRKRLKFQCWHRGFREIDLILGHFADHHLATMDQVEIADLEALLCLPDQEIYEWITGKTSAPEAYDSSVLRRIKKLDFLDDTLLRG